MPGCCCCMPQLHNHLMDLCICTPLTPLNPPLKYYLRLLGVEIWLQLCHRNACKWRFYQLFARLNWGNAHLWMLCVLLAITRAPCIVIRHQTLVYRLCNSLSLSDPSGSKDVRTRDLNQTGKAEAKGGVLQECTCSWSQSYWRAGY